ISSEPRVIVRHEADAGEAGERARLALDLYIRRIVREIGAMAAVLGGLELLVFTAGVGEHNAFVRERVCEGLAFLGVALDQGANEANAAIISSEGSRVRVAVEPTNEEWVAARDAIELVHGAMAHCGDMANPSKKGKPKPGRTRRPALEDPAGAGAGATGDGRPAEPGASSPRWGRHGLGRRALRADGGAGGGAADPGQGAPVSAAGNRAGPRAPAATQACPTEGSSP